MSAAPAAWISGIDEPLPAGERVLWQGSPAWRSLAVRRFHARKIAVYFVLLVAWRGLAAMREPEAWTYFLAGAAPLTVLGAVAVGAVCVFAALVARTTRYAVTDRRLVLRVGVALPSVLNIPLRLVTSAAHQPLADGTGNLAVGLEQDNRFAWLLLWPHSRPWHFRDPEPTLLCVPDSATAGDALRAALAADAARHSDEMAADAGGEPVGTPVAPLKLISMR